MGLANAESLGAFTEEIMEIFDAMRVRKSETKIHWHDFIAAGFSHCKLDYSSNNKLICFNFVVDIIFIFTLNKNCCFVAVFLFVLCFGVSCTGTRNPAPPSLGGNKLAPPENRFCFT